MVSQDRRRARLATLVSFSSFFVFPAIPVGRTGALTIPFFLAAALAVIWLRRLRTSEWWPYAWIMAPLVVSGCYVLIVGAALAPAVVPKAVVAVALPLFVLIPARHLLRGGYGERFVLGAAYAILVHAAVGAYQVFAFERAQFPFAELMRTNPGMAMSPEEIPTYVEYVKRPFGLFAEPSAMAACVGPWLVLITTALFARPRDGSRGRTAILALALASGLALVRRVQVGARRPDRRRDGDRRARGRVLVAPQPRRARDGAARERGDRARVRRVAVPERQLAVRISRRTTPGKGG